MVGCVSKLTIGGVNPICCWTEGLRWTAPQQNKQSRLKKYLTAENRKNGGNVSRRNDRPGPMRDLYMTHGGELQVTSAPSSKSNSSMSESKTEHSHGISMGTKLGMT
ncbi:hypothetical protein VTJ04DRAFT_6990 [Mycothermus thermophilus]|uniref:uncharacterized protein n=1 Tax=Humicola insolens TaxID=85995 RepID=UPI003742A665